MIDPPSPIAGAAARARFQATPNRLRAASPTVSVSVAASSSVVKGSDSIGCFGPVEPALLTRMSIRPNRATMPATPSRTDCGSEPSSTAVATRASSAPIAVARGGRGGLDPVGGAARHHHGRALGQIMADDVAAEIAGGAGDDGDLAGQPPGRLGDGPCRRRCLRHHRSPSTGFAPPTFRAARRATAAPSPAARG